MHIVEMPEARRRRRFALLALGLVIVAGWGAQRALGSFVSVAELERLLAEELGGSVRIIDARVDLLGAGGLLIEGLELELESWVLRIPRTHVRPRLLPLLRGRLEPTATAPGFVILGYGDDGAEIFGHLAELLDATAIPEMPIALQGGTLLTRSGETLLHGLEIGFQPEGEDSEGTLLSLRARQRGGGRLDVRGHHDRRSGALRFDVYLSRLRIEDVAGWTDPDAAGPRSETFPIWSSQLTGSWHLEIEADGTNDHDFELVIAAGESAEGDHRVHLRAEGRMRLAARSLIPSGGFERRFAEGGSIRLAGDVERLRVGGPVVSGPVRGAFIPSGSFEHPRIEGQVDLGAAYVSLPGWLRKPVGLPTRLRLASLPGPEARTTRFDLDVDGMRLAGALLADGTLRGESGWIPTLRLADLCPAVEGRAAEGRIRLASLELRSLDEFSATLDVEEVNLGGARLPIRVEALRGRAHLRPTGLEAKGFRARIAGTPWELDLLAHPPREDGAPWLVAFEARGGDIELAALPAVSGEDGDFAGLAVEGVPLALQQVAKQPIQLLRRERSRIEAIQITRGLVTAPSLRIGDELFRGLHLELTLRDLALGVPRVVFRHRARRYEFSGSIDLNPLVPTIEFVALR